MVYNIIVNFLRGDYGIVVKRMSFLRQVEEFLLSNGSETYTCKHTDNTSKIKY